MKTEPEKLRIVLDTNVLFSMLAFPGGRMEPLLNIILLNKIDLFLSDFILEELSRNLKKKTKVDPAEAIQILKNHATMVHPKGKIDVIKTHEPDNRILECAVEAQAHILVTGNMKDIRPLESLQGIEIISPREFLDQYFQES